MNSAHPDISYEYTVGEVISMTQDAFGGSSDSIATKDLFVVQNELGADIA